MRKIEAPEVFDLVMADSDILYGGELYGQKLAWFLSLQLVTLNVYYRLLKGGA